MPTNSSGKFFGQPSPVATDPSMMVTESYPFGADYGARLIFADMPVNPRNKLGKIGITVHGWFGQLFYNTVKINYHFGDEVKSIFVNKNSLIKWINAQIINQDIPLTPLDKKSSGDDLRNHFDRLRAHYAQDMRKSKSSWGEANTHFGTPQDISLNPGVFRRIRSALTAALYQFGTRSLFRAIIRFLFIHREDDLQSKSTDLAVQSHLSARQKVPAYKDFLKTHAPKTWAEVPETSKDDYIKPHAGAQTMQSLFVDGTLPVDRYYDTSTGTSGRPTMWARSHKEVEAVHASMRLATQLKYGNRRIEFINCFAMGPWATGQTVLRGIGARPNTNVFLANPKDKAQILAHLQMLQMEREKLIAAGKEPPLIMIGGYPPFMKELVEYVESQGVNFGVYEAVASVGGQAMSEALRDFLLHKPRQVGSSSDIVPQKRFAIVRSLYGASDLDINLGAESDFCIALRQLCRQKPDLLRELCGSRHAGLPMIFHYDPLNYNISVNEAGELIYTCVRSHRTSPRIKYNLKDVGKVMALSDVIAIARKYGLTIDPEAPLPLLFVFGRDSTATYRAANVTFGDLEQAINKIGFAEKCAKCAIRRTTNEDGDSLELWIEIHDDDVSDFDIKQFQQQLVNKMKEINQDLAKVMDDDPEHRMPCVRVFARGKSPISDASGERKQVLIIEDDHLTEKKWLMPEQDSDMKESDVVIAKQPLRVA